MTYDVQIVGHKDLLRVEDMGDVLKKKWEHFIKTKQDEVIEVSGFTGRLSSIKSFRLVSASKSDKKTSDDINKEYLKERETILKMSPEEKSKRLGYFRIIYFGFTGKRSEDVKTNSGIPIEELAIKLQRAFFEANPKRILCDSLVFKPIIQSNKCLPAVMGIIESNTLQEFYAVRNLTVPTDMYKDYERTNDGMKSVKDIMEKTA